MPASTPTRSGAVPAGFAGTATPAGLACLCLLLAACGGGSGSGNDAPANRSPVVNAGADQVVTGQSQVSLVGSASDADGDPLTYTWTQTGGDPVVLTSANAASTGFTAPDLAGGASTELSFRLDVSDGTVTQSDTVVVTVTETPSAVTVSGRVNYEFVPPNAFCAGLDFDATGVRPIRRATVQLLDASNDSVLATTTSDDEGNYAFGGIPGLRDVRLRVRAELKRAGSPAWDVEVRDNTSNTGQALALRALYAMDSEEFNTGSADVLRNLTATTGWDGAMYSADRVAAPFAILDAIYSGMRLVLDAEPEVQFDPLDAFWSVNNTLIDGDVGAGEIGTSYYTSDPENDFVRNPSLFLLGDASQDTEEFDDHVVVHEWGHYFEDTLSRSDSIGGAHTLGESLDARVAFGEGFATAFAAMALDEPQYCDTGAPGSLSGFGINAENSGFGGPEAQGWFNEVSVVTLLYDLWDDANDGTDSGSLGFAPIYETMRGPQASTEALTSVFSFAASLRPMLDAAGQSLLDSQLSRENITPVVIDIWADTEMNDRNGGRDVLPLYTDLTADGSVLPICTNSDFDNGRTGNKLAQHRYIRLAVPATDTYNVRVETTTPTPVTADPDDRDQSDPDVYIYREGALVAFGDSPDANLETFVTQSVLQAGVTYVVEVEEWRFADAEAAPPNYPDQICFDVSLTAVE